MSRPAELHQRIAAQCRAIMRGDIKPGDALGDDYPDARALIEAAAQTIEAAIPDRFEYQGKTYFIRARLNVFDVGLHADPGSAAPVVRVLSEGLRWCGHRPGH